jgi:hypothetical protein
MAEKTEAVEPKQAAEGHTLAEKCWKCRVYGGLTFGGLSYLKDARPDP